MFNAIFAGKASIVTNSWTICETYLADSNPADRTAAEQALQVAAYKGVTVFTATGDAGAFDCERSDFSQQSLTVGFPPDSPWNVAVGGTILSVRRDGSYLQETGWQDPLTNGGGGGGVNPIDARPSWQQGPGVDTSPRRGIPDVSAASGINSPWAIYADGHLKGIWGTSAATPFWAASMLLVQQYLEQKHAGPLCFAAPLFSGSLGPPPPRRRYHPFPGGVRQAAPRQSGIQHLPAGLPLYLWRRGGCFEQLRSQVIPKMVGREALELQQRLIDLTSARHNKYGHTIFHLEPNIKDSPGGLRDYQVAGWLSLISQLEKTGIWPAPESLLPEAFRAECGAALDFLSAVRCFLHYRQGRDLNQLTYELQSEAAAAGIGLPDGAPVAAAVWMRTYFRHVRSIYRLTVLFDEVPPSRSGLYRLFENRKSRLSNADFSVVEGRVFLRQLSSVQDPSVLLGLFEFVGRHGLKLTSETERCVEASLPKLRQWAQDSPEVWSYFRRILVSPHAGAALRAMHRLGVLVLLFPEFQGGGFACHSRLLPSLHCGRTFAGRHRKHPRAAHARQRAGTPLPRHSGRARTSRPALSGALASRCRQRHAR